MAFQFGYELYTIYEEFLKEFFADRGYISPKLFDMLFEDGVHLVTEIRTNMKNKIMPMWDKIMLRRRCIIETINDMLKNTHNWYIQGTDLSTISS
ncbi:MAG: hypothetical protein IKA75_01585 [Bacteroidaceae bacterium]|nr:hypothetical protein [Bacteroidaceae bacterium]